MKTLFFSILTMLIIIVVSCSDDPVNTPKEELKYSTEDALIPLAVGNWWRYTIKDYVYDSLIMIPEEPWLKDMIIGMREIDGVQWYVVEGTSSRGGYDTSFVRNTGEGTQFKDGVFRKYPSLAPDTLGYEPNGYSYRIAAIDKEIETPAGTFMCYEFELVYIALDPIQVTKYYYAPQVGYIGVDFPIKLSNSYTRGMWHLESYHLER
jgi:hypothetical protein